MGFIRNNKFNIFVMTVIIGLIMLGVIYSGVFSIVAFMLVCVYFVFASNDIIISDMFFLLPFATVFKASSNSTSFVSVLLIAVIFIFIVRKNGKIRYTPFLLAGMIFSFLIIFIDLIYGNFTVTSILRNLFGILFVYFLIELDDKSILEKVMLSFGYGVFLSSFIALFADDIPNFYTFVRKVGYNLIVRNRFSGMNGDPNYYAICLILVLFGALLLYRKRKLYFWSTLALTFLFGVQTYSKSFLIIFVVALGFIFMDLIKSKNTKMTTILFLGVVFLGLYMFLSGYFSSVDFILGRITNADSFSELTTGRSDIWSEYLGHIFSNDAFKIFFGEGLSAQLLNGKGSHNFYIEIIYFFGFFGFVLFFITFITGYRSVTKGSKGFTAGKAIVLILLTMYFNLQMIASNELYFHIAYVFLICKYDNHILIKRGGDTEDGD